MVRYREASQSIANMLSLMEVNDLVDMLIMIGMMMCIICKNAGSVSGKNYFFFQVDTFAKILNDYILPSMKVCFMHYFKVVLMQIRGTLLICKGK